MFDVRPITGVFGAEISGIDIAEELDDAVVAKLQDAFVEHKVLVFHGQDRVTPSTFARFGRLFGELEQHPFYTRSEEDPYVAVLRTQGTEARENWHSDVTFQEVPSTGSILRAVDVPPFGRDTVFADTEAVYAGLSETMRQVISGLRAVHDWRTQPRFHTSVQTKETADAAAAVDELPPVEHPVVRTHPVTGRKSVFVNPVFTTGIVGMRPAESAALLRLLFDEVHHPEYQLRVRWEPGTVAMWDNRCTQHALVWDSDYPRVMERVQIAGTERPF